MNFDDLKTPVKTIGWDFIVLMSRQGKIRLAEFFSSYTESDKRRILRDIAADVLPRAPKMCNIIEKGEHKFVYRRYASLYFVVGVPSEGTNELIVLEQIHLFVEVSYFVGRERGGVGTLALWGCGPRMSMGMGMNKGRELLGFLSAGAFHCGRVHCSSHLPLIGTICPTPIDTMFNLGSYSFGLRLACDRVGCYLVGRLSLSSALFRSQVLLS